MIQSLRQNLEVNEWSARDLYFGGAHAVAVGAPALRGGAVVAQAAGDVRRGGVGMLVTDETT